MGKKKRAGLAALGAAVALLFGVTPAWGECLVSGSDYTVGAKAAVVMEAQTGTLLFAQEAHKKLPMASTTKIMTALLTLEQEGLDETFTVDPVAIQVEGSSMGLQAGNRLTMTNLVSGMLLASGNDAANAAALYLAGSQEEFAQQMNARAAEIGMDSTHFVTPSGLDDEEHYSTAYDMALLAQEALDCPEFARIAGSSVLQVEFVEPAQKVSYSNHNKLLRMYDGCVGVKTGFTKKAGRCLVSAAQREGTTLIAVTLNAPDDWDDHMAMLDYGFETVKTVSLDGACPENLYLVGAVQDSVSLRAGQGVKLTLSQADASRVTSRVLLPRFAYAPIGEGERLGQVQYLLDGQEIYSVPIFAGEAVEAVPAPKPTGWEKFWSNLTGWFH